MRLLITLFVSLAGFLVFGCGTPSFLITPVSSTNALEEQTVIGGRGFFAPKIAIIEVEGMLANARTGGLLEPTENSLSLFSQELDRAQGDPAVKAVVLRVNSPGGTVSASDAMYDMVKRFRKNTGKPVVASIQEVGASGAYYVSCASDKIVAQPTSIVGSIGVIFESMEFSGTLDKIGARSWAITSGPLKDMGSPFKPLGEPERVVMQDMVNQYFERFVGVVRSNRTVNERPAASLAAYKEATYSGVFSGRVYSGEDAKKLGLIDETGLLPDAINLARQMANAGDASVIMYKRPYSYAGTIYASNSTPPAKAQVTNINIPGASGFVPAGFYFLWSPGI